MQHKYPNSQMRFETPSVDLPEKLYKYRPFNVNTLKMLGESYVFFADPNQFNDPLDCKPTINIDVESPEVERLFRLAAVKNGKDEAHIDRIIDDSRFYFDEGIEHYISDPDSAARNLVPYILNEVNLIIQENGVLSLARSYNCPLMWSHYAEQHKGVCLEYDVSKPILGPLEKVRYDGVRGINCSDLINYLSKNCHKSWEAIRETYFFSKAPAWQYEDEWRYIRDKQGEVSLPFTLSAIYFGMRCELAVMAAVIKIMSSSSTKIDYYTVVPGDNSFSLERRKIDDHELEAMYPRPSAALIFSQVPVGKPRK